MTTRREKVLLELEDHFTAGMARAAAATELLNKNLDSLSGTSVQTSRSQEQVSKSTDDVGKSTDRASRKTKEYTLEMAKADVAASRLRKSLQDEAKAALDAEKGIDGNNNALRDGTKDIDRYSGRLRLLGEAAAFLGPALVPIGAVAVPAVVGLAAGLGAAAGAAGVALLAFNGIGDALKALDAYQLDPTTAHLEKMRQEFEKIGPTGVAFVKFLDDLEPQLKDLQTVARAGLFPGVEAGIASFMTMLPQVRVLLFNLSTELGHLTAEAGKAMSGAGAKAFFDYLERDAAPTMAAFAHTLGNLAQGFGSLMMAFSPLSRDFASGMESMSQSFAKWAAGLSDTDGFRSFVAYVRESGPQVLALLGSLATAFIDIARAAAPVGAAVLPALTALARVLSLIAESPIGPPLFTASVAMLALARATTIANAAMLKFSGTSAAATKNLALVGAGLNFAAILAGIYAVDSAMDKVFGDGAVDGSNLITNLTNLTSSDASSELDKIGVSIKNINSAMLQGEDKAFGFLPGDTTWGEARDNIEKVDQALAEMVQSGNGDQAAAAMDKIVASAKEQGISTAEATKWFKLYNAAVAEAPAPSDAAADSARKLAQAHNQQAASADDAAASTASLVKAMQDEVDAASSAFDAETQYREALKAAAAQAKKNDAGIRGNSKAVLENRTALAGLRDAWNNQSDAVKNNINRYHEARKSFIDLATGMGVPIEKAQSLAKRMLDIPKSIVIKQQNNMDPAVRTARLLAQAIRNIPTSWLTNYTINTIRTGTKPELHAPRADGGQILGQRHPYGDKVLAMLAPGEEVISNRHGQADRFRADRAAGRIPGYAGGGTVGDSTIGTAGLYGMTLTQKQYDGWLRASAKGLQVELTMRQKLLQHEIDRDTKLTQAAQDHVKAVRDDISSLRSSIAERFRSPVFGQEPTANFAGVGLSAEAFRLMNAAPDPLDTLRSDIRDARQANRLYKQLQKAGLHGGALTYAEENASNSELQALLSSGNVKQYQRLYGTRQRVSTAAGSTAAFQRYGDTLNRAVAEFGEAKQTLQRMEQIEKRVEHKLEQIRKENKANSDKNAEDTAAGVNGAASSGANRP